MANNLTSLVPLTTTANALSNLVLVSPQATIGYQPQNAFISNQTASQAYSNPAILFHYEGEQAVTLESDITDHYIEDNTAIQDQISTRPVTIRTHGYIGELNDVLPYGNQILQALRSTLTVINPYTPELTVTGLNAYNEAFQGYQIAQSKITSAISAWATISGNSNNVIGNNGLTNSVTGNFSKVLSNQNKQQLAFQQFFAYWQSKTLFTVQTPWAVFQNMAILRVNAVQSSDTNQISDFEIIFKRIRTASTISTSVSTAKSVQGQLVQQSSALQQSSPTSIAQSPVRNFSLGNFNLQ